MSNETEVLGSLALEARCEARVRVSRAIGAHPAPKDFFGVLVDELRRIVPFDYICVSLRDKNYLTFQNYCVDMASRSAVVPEGTLMLEDSFTLSVCERQELCKGRRTKWTRSAVGCKLTWKSSTSSDGFRFFASVTP